MLVNKKKSYFRYWTGTSLQSRLMRENIIEKKRLISISLTCMPVPVQYAGIQKCPITTLLPPWPTSFYGLKSTLHCYSRLHCSPKVVNQSALLFQVDRHLSHDCRSNLIHCPFKHVGCQHQVSLDSFPGRFRSVNHFPN